MSALVIGDKFAQRSFDGSLISQPRPGSIGIITQSGALKIILLNMMAKENLGMSKLLLSDKNVNKGIDEVEFVKELGSDSQTTVILLCVESINRGRKFMEVAREIAKTKPIVVLKSGKSKAGTEAVFSHTGSLSTSDEIYDAAFCQLHILRAQSIEEMFDFAKALVLQPPALGNKVAILTNGGGSGIIAADACSISGLEVADLSRCIQDTSDEKTRLFLGIHNPFDLRFFATAETYEQSLRFLFACKSIDAIILMVYPSPALDVDRLVDKIVELWRGQKKTLVVSGNGSDRFMKLLSRLECSGIPVYLLPERAVNGMKALVYYGRHPEHSSFSNCN
jgi:acyl-CoA synthetase (NDP forming)